MKIKAITFLFLVTVLNNAYSMSNDEIINENCEKFGEKQFKCKQCCGLFLSKLSFFRHFESNHSECLNKNNCDCNNENKTVEKKTVGIDFNLITKCKGYVEFLEKAGCAELDNNPKVRDGKKYGFMCFVCKKHFDSRWSHIEDHYCIKHKIKIINDEGIYKFIPSEKLSKEYFDEKRKKKSEKCLECIECGESFPNDLKFKKHFMFKHIKFDRHIESLLPVNSLVQNNMQNSFNKTLPSFKDLFGEQNSSNDSENINIGKEPEDKRRKLD